MLYSNCCNALLIKSTDVCSDCKEHCESVDDGMSFDLKEVMKKTTRKVKSYTKEDQLNNGRIKQKKESTFGKKPTKWNNKGINSKPKEKRNDIIDDDYTNWLCKQQCVVTGRRAKRGVGADNMHGHHINGRNGIRNDYKQVPLIGSAHSWGGGAYHNNTNDDFIKKNNLMIENVKEFFNESADEFVKEYVAQGGEIRK